jgi:hypothetical protein
MPTIPMPVSTRALSFPFQSPLHELDKSFVIPKMSEA